MALIDQLRQVELGIHPFSEAFKKKHHELVISHNKMALAYIDMRESRTAMQLLELCLPSTTSSKFEFNFLRVITLNNLACSCRRLGISGALSAGDPEEDLDAQAMTFLDEAFMRLGEAVKL